MAATSSQVPAASSTSTNLTSSSSSSSRTRSSRSARALARISVSITAPNTDASIRSGSSFFKVHGLGADEFPPLPKFKDDKKVALSQETIRAMLKNFVGVLVSDFYAAYDSIECPQQKCLIHFIRDLNDDLLKHPYDDALKRLVGAFAGLVKPMVDTVDRRGLKKRFLGKHRIFVDRFYRRLGDGFGASEAARTIIERLQKNRNTMFTFLDFDDVPWNNNNAEHAIKAFASLRRVIEGPTTEKGLRDFLVLLSLCETCKYKNVDFLDFLRSGSKDIDDFATRRQRRRGGAHI